MRAASSVDCWRCHFAAKYHKLRYVAAITRVFQSDVIYIALHRVISLCSFLVFNAILHLGIDHQRDQHRSDQFGREHHISHFGCGTWKIWHIAAIVDAAAQHDDGDECCAQRKW